jgi:hypothetical protein
VLAAFLFWKLDAGALVAAAPLAVGTYAAVTEAISQEDGGDSMAGDVLFRY